MVQFNSEERDLGIQAYKENIALLLKEALGCLTVSEQRSHALGIYMSAIEECGALLRLRDWQAPTGHRDEVSRALSELPEVCKTFEAIGFQVDSNYSSDDQTLTMKMGEDSVVVDSDATGRFTTKLTVDAIIRHEGTTISWDNINRVWKKPLIADSDEIRAAIEAMQSFVQSVNV